MCRPRVQRVIAHPRRRRVDGPPKAINPTDISLPFFALLVFPNRYRSCIGRQVVLDGELCSRLSCWELLGGVTTMGCEVLVISPLYSFEEQPLRNLQNPHGASSRSSRCTTKTTCRVAWLAAFQQQAVRTHDLGRDRLRWCVLRVEERLPDVGY